MMRILLFAVVISASTLGNVYAENDSYWCEKSVNNPDLVGVRGESNSVLCDIEKAEQAYANLREHIATYLSMLAMQEPDPGDELGFVRCSTSSNQILDLLENKRRAYEQYVAAECNLVEFCDTYCGSGVSHCESYYIVEFMEKFSTGVQTRSCNIPAPSITSN
ncbi:hypothetical protein NFC81_02155 [Salinispirillum sp. LH 10-3-1]|uniref:DUF1311 domain-containing protein n=1 Tax=Salinispirillum sp. LH 10-3-1 TaxID=2952525 RepID=A0AB38YH07_9GAMM